MFQSSNITATPPREDTEDTVLASTESKNTADM